MMTAGRLSASLVVAAALSLLPSASSAQTVVVRVSGPTAAPVVGALAYLVDPSGATVRNALTDERGRALFVRIPAAAYTVRVEMIGMAIHESEPFEVAAGMSVAQDVRLESSAIQLDGIEVRVEGGRCTLEPEGGLAVALVWEEARKALSAAAFTDERGTYRYETMIYNRQLDDDLAILSEEETRNEGYMRTPFDSRPAEDLVSNGFVQADGEDRIYYAPNAAVLLSDAFLDTHCFRLAEEEAATEGMIGLVFEPAGDDKSVVDIAGTLWIDRESAELRRLDFNYEHLHRDISSRNVGGQVRFRRMPSGTWIIPEWWIRMPVVGEDTDEKGRPRRFVIGFHVTGGLVLEVREAGGRSLGQRVQTGGVEGMVVDSIGLPRRGVRVRVVGSNQQVFTTSEGRYSITGLNPGRYQVGFVDPDLEAYGFVPEAVARDVIRGEMTTLDLHLPAVGDILFDACRDQPRPEDSAVLAGTVRDARSRPLVGATVRVRWTEYRVSPVGGATRFEGNTLGSDATSDARGFYLFCSVPRDVLLDVQGLIGDQESEFYPVRIDLDRGAVLQAIEIERGGTR
jgi:hypothetical protein